LLIQLIFPELFQVWLDPPKLTAWNCLSRTYHKQDAFPVAKTTASKTQGVLKIIN